jgi:hypothetical protein
MPNRTTATRRFDSAGFAKAATIALPVILFGAMLLFGILVSLRYAYGWTEVLSTGATAVPMTADGLVGFASAVLTGLGAVWFYVRQIAH